MSITLDYLRDYRNHKNVSSKDMEQLLQSFDFGFVRNTIEGVLWRHRKYPDLFFQSGGNHGHFEDPAKFKQLYSTIGKIQARDQAEKQSGIKVEAIDLAPLGLHQAFEAIRQGNKVTLSFKDYPELHSQFEASTNINKMIAQEASNLCKQNAPVLHEIEMLAQDYKVECVHEKDTLYLVQEELGISVSCTKNGQSFAEHLTKAIGEMQVAAQEFVDNRLAALLKLEKSGFTVEMHLQPEKGGMAIVITHLAKPRLRVEFFSSGSKGFIDSAGLKAIEALEQQGLKELSPQEKGRALIEKKRIELRKTKARERTNRIQAGMGDAAKTPIAFLTKNGKKSDNATMPACPEPEGANTGPTLSPEPEHAPNLVTALCVLPDTSKWGLVPAGHFDNPFSAGHGR